MTEVTNEARKTAIESAVAVAEKSAKEGKGTAQTVKWKNNDIVLPVASVDVDLVLLNPHSHRISAQLQSLPQNKQEEISKDPFGKSAQDAIADLLRETSGYERIKNALANDGQQDHGVLTTAGVLVNANTRVVALRELREKYVKVVVLPDDATSKEIMDLELRLQMEREVKQPYSFTSSLLFIEDLINSGNYTTVEVGQALYADLSDSKADKKKASTLVELELRLLGLIREVMTSSGGVLNFLSFDDKRQALTEIDEDYQKLKNSQPEEALRIRDAQLAGLIVGIDYRKLREIDSKLMDEYVAPALAETANLADHVDTLLADVTDSSDAPEGLDLLDEDESSNGAPSLTGLYTMLAKSQENGNVSFASASGDAVELPRKAVAADLYGALVSAIENKQRDSRRLDDLTAPMVLLKEATRSIDKARAAYVDARSSGAFSKANFMLALQEFRRAVAELETETPAEPAGDPSSSDTKDA